MVRGSDGDSESSGSDRTQPPETPLPEPLPSNRKRGKHNRFTHFPNDPNCYICRRTKVARAPCRRNPENQDGHLPRATNVGDIITVDHQILNEELPMYNQSFTRFLEQEDPKVVQPYNSLEFIKACEGLFWNHCTSTPHRPVTTGIAERAVRKSQRMHFYNYSGTVSMGRTMLGRCSGIRCCFLRIVKDLLAGGKTPYKRRFGEHFEVLHLEQNLFVTPLRRKTKHGLTRTSRSRSLCETNQCERSYRCERRYENTSNVQA